STPSLCSAAKAFSCLGLALLIASCRRRGIYHPTVPRRHRPAKAISRTAIFRLSRARTRVAHVSHYFDSAPGGPGRRRTIEGSWRGHRLEVLTSSGVFSGDRLDPGTAVLLRTVADPPREGTLLDLGCGWGPVALSMARAAPAARVLAVDV